MEYCGDRKPLMVITNGRGVNMVPEFDIRGEKGVNMKLRLYIFEKLSGLRTSFHKSSIFCFGEVKKVEKPVQTNFQL
jgi:hypothetical protein